MIPDPASANTPVVERINAALLKLPTEQLIIHSIDIVRRNPLPPDDESVRNEAMAGAYAWLAVRKYRTAMDQVIERHRALRDRIRRDRSRISNHGWATAHEDEAADLRTETWYAGGVQEVETHFFVTCAITLKNMLTLVASVVGTTIPAADLCFLAQYVDLRNDFEHPIERFTGPASQQKLVQQTGTTIRIGPSVDANGRYKVGSQSYEINAVAFDRVRRIVDQAEERVRDTCIVQARAFIEANPDLFPDVKSAIRGIVSRLSYYPSELAAREM